MPAKKVVWIILVILLAACRQAGTNQAHRSYIDSLNNCAYRLRYSDIDSTRNIALRAEKQAQAYTDGKARAQNMLAYVAYQQMDFETALARLDTVGRLTNNQVILLVADVLRMKVNQRTGDGMAFFEARESASRRMNRAEEEKSLLGQEDLRELFFARTEYHIISSTYYFYLDQQEEARQEMAAIEHEFITVSDSTQWFYYNYMMGSGGMVEGEPQEVALQEFLYLMKCYGPSRSKGVTYFEANAMQALAALLCDEANRTFIARQRPDLYQLLLYDHEEWLPQDSLSPDDYLPEALAQHAVYTFRRYKDLFQMACAYRTLGEISFRNGRYEQALHNYSVALDCVNEQFFQYHAQENSPQLLLYDEDDGLADTELQWIDADSIHTVPEWIAGIRQQISMAFSALGMKKESDYNRNIYLDIIARTSQNYEMEGRKELLQAEAGSLKRRLVLAALFFAALVMVVAFCYLRIRKHNDYEMNLRADEPDGKRSQKAGERLSAIKDRIEDLEENTNLCNLKIATHKRSNVERRAKVSLVQAVTPFLDRILNEIYRMNRNGIAKEGQMAYVMELTDRIVTYNDLLTEWIKMEQGELSLQITTIQLQNLFQILSRGHYAYDQKGIELDVHETNLSVKADEALTLFMLNTLADNARKFTPAGGRVTVEAEAAEDYVELSVTDTGCGMSPEDVETLSGSKVYDARKIGTGGADGQTVAANKGFGFGIMNCRGIIEKYRKTSAIFQVCRFGVQSEMGKGSRFYFRLPRVATMLFCLLVFAAAPCKTLAQGHAAAPGQADSLTSEAAQLYEKAYQSNLEEDYAAALQYGAQALRCLHPALCLSAEEEQQRQGTNEQELFGRRDTIDYLLAVNVRNEMACAALALNEWELYRYNNRLCTTLYKLCHQDHSLPTYCQQLQRTQTTSRQLLVLLILFAVLTVFFSLILLRRHLMQRFTLMAQAIEVEEIRQDELNHLRYEENRVHVQNQMLDNCLSTIKHESMYYPARIRQLAERYDNGGSTDFRELTELAQYYKEIYTLLSAHAERQTAQNCYRMEQVELQGLLRKAQRHFQKLARKANIDATLVVPGEAENILYADPVLLEELFERFNKTFVQWLATKNMGGEAESPRLTVGQETGATNGTTRITFHLPGIRFTEEEAHNMFYPEARQIHLLVAKQIIRELDALCNFPGLRLVAESGEEETVIWFTLK